jgi:hypothetical protein
MNIHTLWQYGEKVNGYSVRVLNEREARAAAGILFAFGLIGLFNSVTLGHGIFTRVFITVFTFDFLMRVIWPQYAPSLLLGRLFVRNQTPEYVGAVQKRFAWLIGLALAVPMFYVMVIDPHPSIFKIPMCIVCLILLFLESAFSICVGCALYGWVAKEPVTLCPGDACDVRTKDPIQMFSPLQKVIAAISLFGLIAAFYLYFTQLENRTFLAEKFEQAMMSEEEINAQELKKQEDEFNAPDEDF